MPSGCSQCAAASGRQHRAPSSSSQGVSSFLSFKDLRSFFCFPIPPYLFVRVRKCQLKRKIRILLTKTGGLTSKLINQHLKRRDLLGVEDVPKDLGVHHHLQSVLIRLITIELLTQHLMGVGDKQGSLRSLSLKCLKK